MAQMVKVILIKNILHVLINNSRTAWPTEMLITLFKFPDNMLQDIHISFSKRVVWDRAQNMLNLKRMPTRNRVRVNKRDRPCLNSDMI